MPSGSRRMNAPANAAPRRTTNPTYSSQCAITVRVEAPSADAEGVDPLAALTLATAALVTPTPNANAPPTT